MELIFETEMNWHLEQSHALMFCYFSFFCSDSFIALEAAALAGLPVLDYGACHYSPAHAGKNKKLLVGTSEMQDVHTHQRVETRARKEPEMGARHKYDVLKLSGGMPG